MQRFIAIYLRVSSRQQDTRSQEPGLNRWIRESIPNCSTQRSGLFQGTPTEWRGPR
jgi:hypothetical protein